MVYWELFVKELKRTAPPVGHANFITQKPSYGIWWKLHSPLSRVEYNLQLFTGIETRHLWRELPTPIEELTDAWYRTLLSSTSGTTKRRQFTPRLLGETLK